YLDADARRAMFGPPDATHTAPPPSPPEAPEAPAAPPAPAPLRTRHSGARVRSGGSVTGDADETVSDVVVIGGTARVMGEVDGDLVVIGGAAYLGPHAEVRKDVTVIGGTLSRHPRAHVGGRVTDVGPGATLRGCPFGRPPFNRTFLFGSVWGGLFAFVSTLCYLAAL